MGPTFDIYTISDKRDRESINAFIDRYVAREKHTEFHEQYISILNQNITEAAPNLKYEDEPAISLDHIIDRGLSVPFRCFTVFLKSKRSDIYQTILSFTIDGKIIFGLSVDCPDQNNDDVLKSKLLLQELMRVFSTKYGFCACEEPPPLSEKEFISILSMKFAFNIINYEVTA